MQQGRIITAIEWHNAKYATPNDGHGLMIRVHADGLEQGEKPHFSMDIGYFDDGYLETEEREYWLNEDDCATFWAWLEPLEHNQLKSALYKAAHELTEGGADGQ